MTNAVRHSGAHAINVLCRVAPPSAEIVISDDGRGLGTGRDDSHGLEIMRERAALIDADLERPDNVPHGTVRRRTSGGQRRVDSRAGHRTGQSERMILATTSGDRMSIDAGPLRVLIVDDHELIREGLVGAFAREDADRGDRGGRHRRGGRRDVRRGARPT